VNRDIILTILGNIIPEAILGVAACVLFIGATFRFNRHLWGALALISLLAAMLALAFVSPSPVAYEKLPDTIYISSILVDRLAVFVKWVALVGGVVLVLLSWDEVPDRQAAEYHGCLLFIVAGLCLTGAANELVTLFLALELISIPSYILLYLPRFDPASQEASMKYFLLSVFSSALLLFGFSYLYGMSGTTNLSGLLDALTPGEPVKLPAVTLLALVMVVAGVGFKITAVPFHFYAPDVYQGAPTAGAALLAFVPKVAGFVALVRLLGFVRPDLAAGVPPLSDQVPILFWMLAAISMFCGNVLALLQSNLKRLLAYSSIAHAGYMLIGLAVAHPLARSLMPDGMASAATVPGGVASLFFYLVAYGAMTVGAFAVLSYLSTAGRSVETEDDLAGLSQSHPGLALLLALFLFSLIGLPLTAGFFGKVMLFFGALAVEGANARLYRALALVGVINAAIGGWYYLRILARMYLQTSVHPLPARRPGPGLAAIAICAALTLALGIYPSLLMTQVNKIAPNPKPSDSRLAASRSPWYRRLERSPNPVLSTQYSVLRTRHPQSRELHRVVASSPATTTGDK
jgi:NADH-quinone oxidoreductase subunit N